ncbi:MAG: hemerythrin domain-containing protein [Pseudomonadota bacterium]
MVDDYNLNTRTAVPEHLRVLSDRYPRAQWEAHRNLDGLTRFWLDRHLMFRKAHSALVDQTEAFLDGNLDPGRFRQDTQRLAGYFINGLHAHHHIEDTQFFPQLSAKDARLGEAFDLLDRDHDALEEWLARLTTAVNGLVGPAPVAIDAAGSVHKDLVGFGGVLDRHLCDEEEIVVPVILEHGGPEMT